MTKILTLAIAAALVAIATPDTAPTDWPSFRGPNAAGIGAGNPPVTWNLADGTNVAWRTPVAGLGHSSPIAWGDRIYVTTAVAVDGARASVTTGDVNRAGIDTAGDRGEHEWRLLAIDRRTGDVAWETVAHRGRPRLGRHVKASHASATPATNGSVIVALMGSEGLFAFDMSGRPLWRTDLGVMDTGLVDDPTYQWGPASSPVIAGDLVLVQNDRHQDAFLAAYDLATGRERWRSTRDEMPSWATPVVVSHGGRTLVVTSSPRRIRAHDLATGREVWWLEDGTQVKVPSPVIADGRAIATGGYAPGTRPTWAIPLSATGLVEADDLAWQIDRGSPYTTTPVAHGGLLYMVTDAGILSAYDVATGERLYQERLGGGAGFSASPVLADGRLYFGSEDGDVFVIRAGRTFELLATNSVGQIVMATPAIAGDQLIIRGVVDLFAFSR